MSRELAYALNKIPSFLKMLPDPRTQEAPEAAAPQVPRYDIYRLNMYKEIPSEFIKIMTQETPLVGDSQIFQNNLSKHVKSKKLYARMTNKNKSANEGVPNCIELSTSTEPSQLSVTLSAMRLQSTAGAAALDSLHNSSTGRLNQAQKDTRQRQAAYDYWKNFDTSQLPLNRRNFASSGMSKPQRNLLVYGGLQVVHDILPDYRHNLINNFE